MEFKTNFFQYQKRLEQMNKVTEILRSFYDEDPDYLVIDNQVMSGNIKELDCSLLKKWVKDFTTIRLFVNYITTREWLLKEIEKLRTALNIG